MGLSTLRRKTLMRLNESAWGSLIGRDKLTLNQRVQGSSPCAPTNKIMSGPETWVTDCT